MTKRKNPYNIKYIMERDNCSEEQAIETINILKNKTSGSLNSFIKRYGEELGLEKYNEFCKKSAITKEKFIKKFGDNLEFEWQKYLKTKDSTSLEFHIQKYGEELGLEKYNERLLNIEQSLNSFIKRYGEELGLEKYNEMNMKRSFSCSTVGLIDKYGIETTLEINSSKSLSGEKNGMYGKPSPMGSGNGWSGWFNKFHFRSLMELSYMIHLTENNISFKTAENKLYEVEYFFNNSKRTYRADFIVDNKIIEIKPKNLLNTSENKAKFSAAKEKFGESFVILTEYDFPIIKDISELVLTNKIKLTKRYEDKFYENYKH
jgi:hypothetical protein